MTEARAELFRSLGALTESPTPAHAGIAEALGLPDCAAREEHTEVFAFQLYPYASVYLGEKGMLGGEARDRIAGFFRAIGIVPPAEPDHIAVLLALYASLIEAEEAQGDVVSREMLRRTRKALLWEHLLSWLPPYLDKMMEIAPPAYRGWAELLGLALSDEAQALGRPDGLPLQLRETVARDPADGKSFIEWLLSPVNSGVIIVRSDLRKVASDLKLGLRVGERRWVIESLLGQDPQATLSWLASFCRHWSESHRRWVPVTGDVGRFWLERAEGAQRLVLRALAETEEVVAQPTVGV